MWRRKRLNLLNILYYYVQRCIASSNNSSLDTKSHLSTEIVLVNYCSQVGQTDSIPILGLR